MSAPVLDEIRSRLQQLDTSALQLRAEEIEREQRSVQQRLDHVEELRTEALETIVRALRCIDDALDQLDEAPLRDDPETDGLRTAWLAVRHTALAAMQRIHPDQSWFWTREWQQGERTVDRNREAGRLFGPYTEPEFDIAMRAHLHIERPHADI